MTKPHLYVLLTIPLLLMAGCSYDMRDSSSPQFFDEDILSAQRVFEEEVVRLSSISTRTVNNEIHPQHIFQLGSISPDWTIVDRITNKKSKNKYIEVPLTTTFRYRVLQSSSEEKKPRKVKVYHELLVSSNTNSANPGIFLVFYIASNKYIKWNKGFLNQRFDNSGDMKRYSGLKIYTDLDGRIIRINKYVDGKKTIGIFTPGYSSKGKKELLNAFMKEQFKNMRFQYGRRIAPATRGGEDDDSWGYDDWDQDPYDDDHFYAPDDEIDPGYCSPGGDDSFWFGDSEDDDYFDPDDDNGYGDWNDDYDTLYGNNQSGTNDEDDEDNKGFGNKETKKKIDTSTAKSKYQGYKDGVRTCFQVAEGVMKNLGVQWPQGSNYPKYRIELTVGVNKNGNLIAQPVSGAITSAISYIVSTLDNNKPILVGMDYKPGGQREDSTDVTDHFIVITGYEVTGASTIQFHYVETAFGDKDKAFNETHVLTYSIGDDYISGQHWYNPNQYYYNVSHVRKNP